MSLFLLPAYMYWTSSLLEKKVFSNIFKLIFSDIMLEKGTFPTLSIKRVFFPFLVIQVLGLHRALNASVIAASSEERPVKHYRKFYQEKKLFQSILVSGLSCSATRFSWHFSFSSSVSLHFHLLVIIFCIVLLSSLALRIFRCFEKIICELSLFF